MVKTLVALVGYYIGYSNGMSVRVGVGKNEESPLLNSLVSYGGSEISYSGGISGGEFYGKIEGYPLGGYSSRMSGEEVE